MTTPNWMIYGANGYTGELIAQEAKRRGLTPILAGRNREPIEALGRELDLPTRVVSLKEPEALERSLKDVDLVLHCAGPFVRTNPPMLEACLTTGTHYLDITGEIAVLESVMAPDEEARAAAVALLPGVGFDVVPKDCLAGSLGEALSDATDLELAFTASGGSASGIGFSWKSIRSPRTVLVSWRSVDSDERKRHGYSSPGPRLAASRRTYSLMTSSGTGPERRLH